MPFEDIFGRFGCPVLPTDINPSPTNTGKGIIKRMRKEIVTVWPILGHDGTGRPVYGEPAETWARWDDVQTKFLAPSGEELVSRAVVYPQFTIEPGSIMTRRPIDQLADQNEWRNNENTFEVKGRSIIPKLRYDDILYIVYLD